MIYLIPTILLSINNPGTDYSKLKRVIALTRALQTSERLPFLKAFQHAAAAVSAETPMFRAEELTALAGHESHFSVGAISRVEKGKRITGIPMWTEPPKFVSGPFFCGVTQAEAHMSWDDCKKLMDISTAYKKTVEELGKWRAACISHGFTESIRGCYLSGYNAGTAGMPNPESSYVQAVDEIQDRITTARKHFTNI